MSLTDGQISSLDVPQVAKCIKELNYAKVVSCGIIQNTDGRGTSLLRPRRERPRSSRAAEQRDELAPSCMSRKEHCEG